MQLIDILMILNVMGSLLFVGLVGDEMKTKRENKNILDLYRVNINTIIRTQDSRALGAKYLNETELPTNEDCLYWCYNTNRCNVAVYKEKDKKSCYLFDCGSHNNFRCMFTQHTFYTSSILHTNHHSHDLSEWGIQEKHENELSHLHLLSTDKPPVISPTNSPMSQPAVIVTGKPDTSTVKTKEVSNSAQGPRCQHYQFRCQNSSDCIAIYNVCDGIPQCSDGSDESSDLHCPNSGNLAKSNTYSTQREQPSSQDVKQVPSMAPPPSSLIQSPVANGKSSIHRNPSSSYHDPSVSREDNSQWGESYHHMNSDSDQRHQMQQSPDDAPHSFSHKHSNFVAANNNYPHGSYMNQWHDYYDAYTGRNIPQQRAEYQEYNSNYQNENQRYSKGPTGNHYNSYQENGYYQPRLDSSPNYNENLREDLNDNRHGKSSTFQDEQMYQQTQWNEHGPLHYHNNQAPENSIQPYAPKPEELGTFGVSQSKLPTRSHHHQSSLPNANKDQSENFQAVQPQAQYPLIHDAYQQNDPNLYQPMVEIPVHSSSPVQEHVIPTGYSESSTDSGNVEKQQETKKRNHIHTINQQSYNRQIDIPHVSMSAVELQESIHKHAEESNSAILALTLGLCVTAILLVLVGCRMRSIRRRLARRKRSALVHDADYLVNGMYL